MLGERLDRNHISQHGLHTVSTMPTLFAGAVGEAVNVFDREHWSSRAPREDRHTTLEAHVRVCDPPKQGFDELINTFAGLASKIGESFFQRGVDGDRGVGHVSVIVPRRRRKDEP